MCSTSIRSSRRDPLRDRFILSKGHAAAALYATLAMKGYFPIEELDTYCQDGGRLAEHPPANLLPGVEAATGSLGHGLPLGCGMALSGRIKGESFRVFALLSDGENNEGSVWEAAMFAAAQKLENVCVIVDYNKWQATARSNETLMLAPLRDKWAAFGWDAHRDRRPRRRRAGGGHAAHPERLRQAGGADRPHRQGQGRVVHGGRQQLALPRADRRRSRQGAQGAWPGMRNAFADELTKLGNEDPRVVMLSGDIGNRLFDKFKAKHPPRFFNCGVAEANMMGVAAGMAMNGLRPVAYTITPFVTTRCLEQIRTDVCYHEAPVTIVAVGAGLAYSGLGPTHHACEDISFLRSIPNMVVICPGDAFEVRGALARRHAAGPPGLYPHGQEGRAGRAQGADRRFRDRQGDHDRRRQRCLPALDRQHAAGGRSRRRTS